MSLVEFATEGEIAIVTINRPEARNAVDRPTAAALAETFRRFDADDALSVAILTGAGGTFCAGADLKAVATDRGNRISADGDGPLGCTRMLLAKPVIAAVEGFAVAGGIELALWCDLRVAARNATFGVYCRRFGVPLCDGGTIRLPRLIGMSRAMDLILTGRGVTAPSAPTTITESPVEPRVTACCGTTMPVSVCACSSRTRTYMPGSNRPAPFGTSARSVIWPEVGSTVRSLNSSLPGWP